MFSPQTSVVEYARLAYFPDRLPGPAHAKTRGEYELQIAKLQRHFAAWLANLDPPEPPRPVALADFSDAMLKFAMAVEVDARETGGRGNAPGTANKLYRHIKSLWHHAAGSESRGGPQLVNRLCFTRPYKTTKRKARTWYPEHVEQIVYAACTAPGWIVGPHAAPVRASAWWSALVLTDLSTAVRITPLMLIPTANWDPVRGQVRIDGDTNKDREDEVFDLYESANEALLELAPHKRGLATLFGDWPYDPDRGWRVLRRHLRKLLVRAGLFDKPSDVGRLDLFHKFRRTVATEIAITKGRAAAQTFLGHSSPQVTARYIDEGRMPDRVRITDVALDPGAAVRLKLFSESASA